ncbi:hypothetical protein COU20_00355 [Candidatus Kaiserbacteria bacterium CG10_big_fil_rev_8_21_14_0_10_59_10]|uniref:EfeO-type cupredoxin-like domain-containing protein n=1 Tax=Candidatus Kaiserbacteria bacterium CG10_big_fil_rev_8_21_14_0_10_59_10 TaxID=1974612 RepID=A0A2H0U8P8_9BACT|nr:MAG: hypothetical protein COU20_00355 [Candidatus Kaiserbacteria bacterium CG10_big_fil_rev_8_21_14_0_10_59_10]
MRSWAALCTALVLAPALFAHAHSEEERTIRMTAEGYVPSIIEVHAGDTVIFINDDTREHWPASNIHPTHSVYPDSSISKCGTDEEHEIFDACRPMQPGEVYEFTFEHPGVWRCHDHINPNETCAITVLGEEGDSGARSERGTLAALWDRVRIAFARAYYALFPRALDAKFSKIDMREAAGDERSVRALLIAAGPERVMRELLASSGEGTLWDCHQEAHVVGKAAYELYGAEVFRRGSMECHSGFIHGAMETFLSQQGTADLAEKIGELCAAFPSSFGIFECLHGVGHGVMAYQNYDLPAALEECGKLETDFDRSSCYGGVFMENIVAAQGFGANPDHETEWVSWSDPHFPCNTVSEDEQVLTQCYLMQTSWMLTIAGYDFEAVGRQCAAAPSAMRATCHVSLGRDIAGYTQRNTERILELCAVASPAAHRSDCVVGALNVVLDFAGGVTPLAHQLCEAATGEAAARCRATLEARETEF